MEGEEVGAEGPCGASSGLSVPPAGCVPHRSRVLVEPRQPRAHRDEDGATLTSFHTGFTLFLITFVFFFTPVGSKVHGSDGNGPKIQLPPL